MFKIEHIGPGVFKVSGEVYYGWKTGYQLYEHYVRSMSRARALAVKLEADDIRTQCELAEQRDLRLRHAHEYLARRRTRSLNMQLELFP